MSFKERFKLNLVAPLFSKRFLARNVKYEVCNRHPDVIVMKRILTECFDQILITFFNLQQAPLINESIETLKAKQFSAVLCEKDQIKLKGLFEIMENLKKYFMLVDYFGCKFVNDLIAIEMKDNVDWIGKYWKDLSSRLFKLDSYGEKYGFLLEELKEARKAGKRIKFYCKNESLKETIKKQLPFEVPTETSLEAFEQVIFMDPFDCIEELYEIEAAKITILCDSLEQKRLCKSKISFEEKILAAAVRSCSSMYNFQSFCMLNQLSGFDESLSSPALSFEQKEIILKVYGKYLENGLLLPNGPLDVLLTLCYSGEILAISNDLLIAELRIFDGKVAKAINAFHSVRRDLVFQACHAADDFDGIGYFSRKGRFLFMGNLMDSSTFNDSSVLHGEFKIEWHFASKRLLCYYFVGRALYRLEFPFAILESLLLIDLNKGCFCWSTKRIPFLFKTDECHEAEFHEECISKQKFAWSRVTRIEEKYKANAFSFCAMIKCDDEGRKLMKLAASLESFNFSILFTCLQINSMEKERRDFLDCQSALNLYKRRSFEVDYTFMCLMTQCEKNLSNRITRKFMEMINSIADDNKFLGILFAMTDKLNDRFCNPERTLQVCIEQSSSSSYNCNSSEAIRFVTITPTRILFHPAKEISANRVTRAFNSDFFLRVQFRDEDEDKISSTKSDLANLGPLLLQFHHFLSNGIHIAGRHYEFLAMSNSQLRDHGCWFFASYCTPNGNRITASDIRKWMGDFTSIKCVGKYVARLGQSLSSSMYAGDFAKNFIEIPDILVDDYNFTDGIGKISLKKAWEMKEIAGIKVPHVPSAFQIRFQGYKGVVSIDPKLDGHVDLCLRPSMKKFDSCQSGIDVLNYASPIACYLNRQVIMILSALGVPDDNFIALQDEMISHMLRALVDGKNFNFTPPIHANSDDPFYQSILHTIYSRQHEGILSKSKVFVRQGRILMGVVDEYQVLKAGEVFIKISPLMPHEEEESGVIERRVVVAKNPCMHPGDVRILNSVYHESLSHLQDVIVFPSVGMRPIPNMCSGSDLDGDLYFVTWDERLIPPREEEPMQYNASAAVELSRPVLMSDVHKFMLDFMLNDQMGVIANTHVALADQSEQGVCDEKCKMLAKLFSQAVDFPKTGKVAMLPQDVKISLYPDFMQKAEHNSYPSSKVIGKMYRKCKKISLQWLADENRKVSSCNMYLVHGYEKYLHEASLLYSEYRLKVKKICNLYSISSDIELVCSNFFMNHFYVLKNKDVLESACIAFDKVQAFYKKLFYTTVNEEDEMQLRAKASAWYKACYDAQENEKFLSFAWIMNEHLTRTAITKSYFDSIDLVALWKMERISIKQHRRIQHALNEQFDCSIVGAAAFLLRTEKIEVSCCNAPFKFNEFEFIPSKKDASAVDEIVDFLWKKGPFCICVFAFLFKWLSSIGFEEDAERVFQSFMGWQKEESQYALASWDELYDVVENNPNPFDGRIIFEFLFFLAFSSESCLLKEEAFYAVNSFAIKRTIF